MRMNVLVNALSVTNQSGAHVLEGHLHGLVESLSGVCRFTVIARRGMTGFVSRMGTRVEWIYAPEGTVRWLARTGWEYRHLERIARECGAGLYFTPSGIAAQHLTIPQVVFCQNPWALVPEARRYQDACKAWLQRRAYRQSMRVADVMVFNSRFMQHAYRQNAGHEEQQGLVAYQAADAGTHERARTLVKTPRVDGQVLCVSAMGRHKNVETVIRALAMLVRQGMDSVRLVVAGRWPDAGYARAVQCLTKRLGVADRVRFAGFVSREALDLLYAQSQVFCLMSRCESFGIPAIEAQLFGTPVISSNVCAVPEICGDGGWFFAPDDVQGVANGLSRLLSDSSQWSALSHLARQNAMRFTWPDCSRPLVDLIGGFCLPDKSCSEC